MPTIKWQEDYEAAASDDWCAPRSRLVIPSKLRRPGARATQTLVLDLSLAGFSALASSRIAIGTRILLSLPGMDPREAEVVWWHAGIVGCAFDNLLTTREHDTLVMNHSG